MGLYDVNELYDAYGNLKSAPKKRRKPRSFAEHISNERTKGSVSAEIYHQTGRALDLAGKVVSGIWKGLQGWHAEHGWSTSESPRATIARKRVEKASIGK
jgi:hypothetical protein